MLAQTHFLSQWTDEWQAFWSHFGALGGSKRIFQKIRGGQGEPKGRHTLSKGGLGGVLLSPEAVKVRNGHQNCILNIVEITLVFVAFSSMWVGWLGQLS